MLFLSLENGNGVAIFGTALYDENLESFFCMISLGKWINHIYRDHYFTVRLVWD